jgi:polysaccharide deacetylase family protein (PEP-CTERM system associated)
VADRHPALVRRIADAGHEVGSHGWSHQFIYAQSREVFRSETDRSRKLLQDLAGQAVRGYRAASFSITGRSLWALDVLIDAGFEYDSSIFPIRHDFYGVPGAEREPSVIGAPSGRAIVEFPMAVARFAGARLPVSGGGYFRLLPYWLSRAGMRRVNESDGLPVPFYMHPWEIDAGQPRFAVSALSRFRHYTNLARCEDRLRRLLGEFEFSTMQDVLAARGLLGRAPARIPAIAVGEGRFSGIAGAAG